MTYSLNVIDRITKEFTDYIDSGFGILEPDVAYLTTILVTLDIVLAGLFRALLNDQYMPINIIQKTLYIGFFAFILNNFQELSNIIFQTFAALGAKAGQSVFDPQNLTKPGFIAQTGFQTGRLLIQEAGEQFFSWSFNSTKLSALVLLPAGLFVILAFLILAVHIFIAIIEFKLTTLVGFILVPFALFGKTTFLADRVLNNVMNSGIKLMILGVIAGIGSSIFQNLTMSAQDITLEEAASAVMASLAILGLSYAVTDLSRSMILGAPILGSNAARQTSHIVQQTTLGASHRSTKAAAYLGGGKGPTHKSYHQMRTASQTGTLNTERSSLGTRSSSSPVSTNKDDKEL